MLTDLPRRRAFYVILTTLAAVFPAGPALAASDEASLAPPVPEGSPSAAAPMRNAASLFNGRDLAGWDVYLGNNEGRSPLINNDARRVFSVVLVDGTPAIRVSGELLGALTTQREFENFHLRFDFKWGVKKWSKQQNSIRDSGVLYHCVRPFEDNTGWMRSFEFQIGEMDTGDFWSVLGATADVQAGPMDDTDEHRALYEAWKVRNGPSRRWRAYRKGAPVMTIQRGGLMKGIDSERSTGQWNVLDLFCLGGTSVHVVNGRPNMVLTNLRQEVGGKVVPLHRGKVQFQSEGSEIFLRNIEIAPLAVIPSEYLDRTGYGLR